MTTKDSPTAENEALFKKVGAIEQEITALRGAIARGRIVRWLLLLAIVSLIGVAIWSFYDLAMQFKSQETIDLFTAKAQERIEQSAGPAQARLQDVYEHCTPVLTEAFQNQVDADMPKYTEAFNKERDLFVLNVQEQLGKQVVAHYESMGPKYQAILQEEFPGIDDPDLAVKVYASLDQTMEKLVQTYYTDQLQTKVEELTEAWEQFEMAEPTEEGLERQFLAALLQLAAYKIDDGSDL